MKNNFVLISDLLYLYKLKKAKYINLKKNCTFLKLTSTVNNNKFKHSATFLNYQNTKSLTKCLCSWM